MSPFPRSSDLRGRVGQRFAGRGKSKIACSNSNLNISVTSDVSLKKSVPSERSNLQLSNETLLEVVRPRRPEQLAAGHAESWIFLPMGRFLSTNIKIKPAYIHYTLQHSTTQHNTTTFAAAAAYPIRCVFDICCFFGKNPDF